MACATITYDEVSSANPASDRHGGLAQSVLFQSCSKFGLQGIGQSVFNGGIKPPKAINFLNFASQNGVVLEIAEEFVVLYTERHSIVFQRERVKRTISVEDTVWLPINGCVGQAKL